MAKRGKVLRQPYAGPGLLIVEGKQYPLIADLWRSDLPAKPGLVVNVDFDRQGNLSRVTAVPESQINTEEPQGAPGAFVIRSVTSESAPIKTAALLRILAAAMLMVSSFYLTAVSIHLPFSGTVELTFWQVLGYLNAGGLDRISAIAVNPDSGILGFIAILVLAAPFLLYFGGRRCAGLAGFLPLAFIVSVAYMVQSKIGGSAYEPVQTSVHHSVFNVISVGLGTYVSVSLAICMAGLSTKQWIAARGHREDNICTSQELPA